MQADPDTLKPLVIRAAGGTDIGCVRKRNEDACLVDAENGIFVVADGVGGHGGGDKAALMATTLLPDIIRCRMAELPEPRSSDDPAIVSILADSLQELGRLIRKAGACRLEYKDMGATVVVALLTAHHAHIAHMGDSRVYLLRDGKLRQLTEDHSIVGILVRNGEITPQEAADHPAKGRLSRFAGMEADVPAATQTIELQAGDRLLLCTDGLWGMLPDNQLKAILAEGNDPEVTCRSLLAAGKQAGGQDNLTAAVCDLLDGARA
jgi:serine/threonine protein phosphatase PrpC